MKILMTGASSLQIKPPEARRSHTVKIDVPGGVVESMRMLGHEVDWRAVTPGEDLSGYDVMWINVAGVNSVNATPGAIGMLWAIAQEHVPAVIFLDDWKTRLTYQQARNFGKNLDGNIYYDRHLLVGIQRLLADANPTHYTRDSAEAEWRRVVDELKLDDAAAEKIRPAPFYAQRSAFTDAEWNALKEPIIRGAQLMMNGRKHSVHGIPAYKWGSTDVVLPHLPEAVAASEIIRLDPSYIAVDIVTAAPRADESSWQWGLAALGDHSEWLEKQGLPFKWGVESIGHRTNRKVKTEYDVVEFYSSCSGILSPSYYHAGSGWWRSRFVYAAGLRLPIYAADGEAAPLGDAYDITPHEVESMSHFARTQLAQSQFETIWPKLSTRDEFTNQVRFMLHRAVEAS